jgi:hypothetical protein
MQLTDCECTEPGWCERHQRFKSPMLFRACERLPALFALWEQGDTSEQKLLSTERLKSPCRHRGEQSRMIECPGCRGAVRLKVFACAIHGECVLAGNVDPYATCVTCLEYSREEQI